MEARIDVITLAVRDLDRALRFYREGLGLVTSGVTGTDYEGDEVTPAGDVVMFEMAGGLVLALSAGATLTEEPHDRPWKIYSGYFRDPDGHLWEIIWNARSGSDN